MIKECERMLTIAKCMEVSAPEYDNADKTVQIVQLKCGISEWNPVLQCQNAAYPFISHGKKHSDGVVLRTEDNYERNLRNGDESKTFRVRKRISFIEYDNEDTDDVQEG